MMDYAEFKTRFHFILNDQQEMAVQKVQGPVLLLAVPGSGKTTVLVTRLAYMLYCCGIKPYEILTMTYTTDAMRDMRERFCSMFGVQFRNALEFRTINGVSARIILYYERKMGRKAFDLITDEGMLSGLIGEIYRRITSEYATESDIKAVRTQISYIKNMLLSDNEIAELNLDDDRPFAPIYFEYCRMLREQCQMDYDDQMVYAYGILRKYPDILRHYQQKYRYLCVDEAQDTSKIQHLIIRLLADAHHNLFMVGDEDQSIYGFRAAYPEALMEFETVYPEAAVLLMEKNYRSTNQIVRQADRFIRQNKARRDKHMITDNADGTPIREIWVYDRKEQYQFIAKLAASCVQETAVLYRDNDSALPVIDILNRQGVGYRCRQVVSTFFSNRIVRDITDIIRFAIDQTDSERFLRIYYKFSAGISKAQATLAAEQAALRHTAVLDALQLLELPEWCRTQVKSLQTNLSHLPKESAERAIYRIVHHMGYGDYLSKRHADQNKVSILEVIAAHVPTPEQLLLRLNELCDIVQAGSTDSQCPFILSTIHSSKGLEYEQVILADIFDGALPQSSDNDNPASLEEERRLFYVALTRAKREVTLVRFKKSEHVSTFANVLFPSQPKTAPERLSLSAIPKYRSTTAQKNVNAIAKEFYAKTRVWHKTFGHGIISERNNNIVTIRFDNGSVKKIDLIVALQANALSLR